MINKKDSGATVLHLTLSEKTKPVVGRYCLHLNYTFFYLNAFDQSNKRNLEFSKIIATFALQETRKDKEK